MKIAQVVVTFPPHIGGMGQVALEESRRLAKEGHDVTVFTLNHGGDYSADHQESFKIFRLSSLLAGDAGCVPQLFKHLRGFDLVHMHYPWYGAVEWVILAKFLYKQKYVVTYHMDAAPAGIVKKMMQKSYDFLFARSLFKNAERIITVDYGHLQATRWGKNISHKKIIELYNGVDVETFKPGLDSLIPTKLAGWERKKIFLFVGNPLPFKRLDFILKAMAKIADENIVLAIVSDGYGIDSYKQLAENLSLGDRVRFVGRVKEVCELNNYYQSAQGLIVASIGAAESFALVLIEALSSGCPVIASDIPGVRSRVNNGEDGILFNSEKVEDLRRAILQIAGLSREERNQLGQKGREKVVNTYSWENHMRQLEALYSCVMNIQ